PAVAVPVMPVSPVRKAGPVSASAPAAPRPAPQPISGKREKITPSQPPKAGDGIPRYLAIFNHKGGTGKTTTAVSVASGLAARGKRVLLVDTDAQGNVSVSLGASSERSLYHVLVMGLAVADAVRTVRPNLDLLPSNETLAAAELYLAGRQNRDRVLESRLAAASAAYDYVVIDCSPSLSLMNQNALCFADSVLVPVACDYLSLVGVRQVIKTVKSVNSILHHPVQIWGVLPTFFDARAKICHEAVNTLKSHFGERCLPPIRAAIKVKEAPAQGQTIFEYAAGTTAADDYGVVVDRIIAAREQAAGRTGADPSASAPVAEAEFTLPRSSAMASA
ncbi:MAG: AAA family ATPase, partial [Minicystis sp.]